MEGSGMEPRSGDQGLDQEEDINDKDDVLTGYGSSTLKPETNLEKDQLIDEVGDNFFFCCFRQSFKPH
jgi:hypothetical protein